MIKVPHDLIGPKTVDRLLSKLPDPSASFSNTADAFGSLILIYDDPDDCVYPNYRHIAVAPEHDEPDSELWDVLAESAAALRTLQYFYARCEEVGITFELPLSEMEQRE